MRQRTAMAASTLTPVRDVVVVGLGATGLACARYLRAQGARVTVVDSRAAPPKLAALQACCPDVAVHLNDLAAPALARADLIVVSPGVSLREPALAQAAARGACIVGDIELFAQAARAPVIAITGSNGKSTVTTLVGEMCRAADLKTVVAGNIGLPVLDALAGPAPDVYVLELSSFQLETTYSLDARAATVLNISPDHMDRYRDTAEYAAAKARIFQGGGLLVLNREDPQVMRMASPGRDAITFGLDAPPRPQDFGLMQTPDGEVLVQGDTPLLNARELPLPGRHNLANVLAAFALVSPLRLAPAALAAAVRNFRGLKHRTQIVGERDGVRWIDDSKGTNVGATVAALAGMPGPVVLIAGGDGKGQDFSELRAPVRAHARAVVLIGRDGPRIGAALGDVVPLESARDMDAAVRVARKLAQPGDVVLLSPACASFDMFNNYEHRGAVFADAVKRLVLEGTSA